MKQVVQPAAGGPAQVIDVPRPTIDATEVLVRTLASVVSPGTERAVTELARSSLLAKAKARPDLVRQLIRKAQRDGVAAAARATRSRLGQDVPLGYSAAGIAVEVGEAVAGVAPGDLVATGGAGKANHAEYQSVPGLLCVPVPDGVPAADAAFATVASIALHALRLAEVGPGGRVVVIGLGLIGQLAVRLARTAGCEVAALDVVDTPVDRARQAGAVGLVDTGEETTKAVREWSRGRGADAVLLAAASPSSAVIRRTPDLCRDGARVVVVGDLGLHIERRPFYERELSVHFARSYGPGRYERSYEDWAVDYPAGIVRWTEGRNIEAVLDLLGSGRLKVEDLVTHRVHINDAAAAYDMLEQRTEPAVAVLFTYPAKAQDEVAIPVHPRRAATQSEPGVGLVGAGAYASTVLVPALAGAGFSRFVAVTSASGLSARRLAERAGFERAVSGADAVIDDPDVDLVVIATPHSSHAGLVTRALRAGKDVYCEKPLALTMEELDEVEGAWRESGRVLFVGFNRRWSPAIKAVQSHFASGSGPLVITYRVNAGTVPERHWYHDRREGGRLLGEVCHFVDTCAAVVGNDASEARAVAGGRAERALHEDVALALAYPGASVASISYATGGHDSTEKERIEILGRGKTATVLDFHTVIIDDGVEHRIRADRKGQKGLAGALRRAIIERDRSMIPAFLGSTRTTIRAAASLMSS